MVTRCGFLAFVLLLTGVSALAQLIPRPAGDTTRPEEGSERDAVVGDPVTRLSASESEVLRDRSKALQADLLLLQEFRSTLIVVALIAGVPTLALLGTVLLALSWTYSSSSRVARHQLDSLTMELESLSVRVAEQAEATKTNCGKVTAVASELRVSTKASQRLMASLVEQLFSSCFSEVLRILRESGSLSESIDLALQAKLNEGEACLLLLYDDWAIVGPAVTHLSSFGSRSSIPHLKRIVENGSTEAEGRIKALEAILAIERRWTGDESFKDGADNQLFLRDE